MRGVLFVNLLKDKFASKNKLADSRSDRLDIKEHSDSIPKNNSRDLQESVKNASNRWMEKNRSLVLRQTPVWAKSLVTLLLSLGSVAVLGGIFIRIDEVITVSGQLKSIGGTVEVETPVGGKVETVHFNDGELVEKGQLLVSFDTREASEQKKTLTRLISLENENLLSKLNTIKSQKASLLKQKDVISQRLKTKSYIIEEMKILVEQGGFQRVQYLQSLDEKYSMESQVSEIDERLAQLDFRSEQIKNESNRSLDQMNNQLLKVNLQLQYQNVTAPAKGVIFDPKASEQGVLSSGERILSIVPQNGLFAEIYVPNSDIGYIKLGQETKVRVDAFPFTKYGELPGSISQIGADALPPDAISQFYRFPVKLNLERSYLIANNVEIPLKTGMSIAANLKLREKRLISILSDLLVDQTDSIRNIRQQ